MLSTGWGIVWKLLLSRLGLFRELFCSNGDRRLRPILTRRRAPRTRLRVAIREPERSDLEDEPKKEPDKAHRGRELEEEGTVNDDDERFRKMPAPGCSKRHWKKV